MLNCVSHDVSKDNFKNDKQPIKIQKGKGTQLSKEEKKAYAKIKKLR